MSLCLIRYPLRLDQNFKIKSSIQPNEGATLKVYPLLSFWYGNKNTLIGYILGVFDDFLFLGTKHLQKTIISKLRENNTSWEGGKAKLQVYQLKCCNRSRTSN